MTNKRFTPTELAAIAQLIAKAAGVSVEDVSLMEEEDGSFTVSIKSRSFNGTLEAVLAWALAYTPSNKRHPNP